MQSNVQSNLNRPVAVQLDFLKPPYCYGLLIRRIESGDREIGLVRFHRRVQINERARQNVRFRSEEWRLMIVLDGADIAFVPMDRIALA